MELAIKIALLIYVIGFGAIWCLLFLVGDERRVSERRIALYVAAWPVLLCVIIWCVVRRKPVNE